MACIDKLAEDILNDCVDVGKKGLDSRKAVLINIDDIDRAATTLTGATITALTLKAGTKGFNCEFYKELASVNSAFAPSTEDVDGFLHNFLCRLPTSSAVNAERAKEIANGRFVAVVETRYKGVDQKDAFKVYGIENGLKLAEMTNDSLANSGASLFTVSTEEGDVEQYPYNIYLDTDYATSKADFDAAFAQA